MNNLNSESRPTEGTTKPFLKWAGSKTQLMTTLLRLLPAGDYRFIEPFVGSGVVFLNTSYPVNVLSDSNHDLIGLHSALKTERHAFIEQCKALFVAENNWAETF